MCPIPPMAPFNSDHFDQKTKLSFTFFDDGDQGRGGGMMGVVKWAAGGYGTWVLGLHDSEVLLENFAECWFYREKKEY